MKFLALLLAMLLTVCSIRTEDSLRAQFGQHKNSIVQILEMQRQDQQVVRIAPSFTWLDTDMSWPRKNIGFSAARWEQYRVLFRKAKIADGIVSRDDAVWYYASSIGLAVGGTSRGYVYSKNVLTPVVDSFDHCMQGEGICYVRLEEHWYLFQEAAVERDSQQAMLVGTLRAPAAPHFHVGRL